MLNIYVNLAWETWNIHWPINFSHYFSSEEGLRIFEMYITTLFRQEFFKWYTNRKVLTWVKRYWLKKIHSTLRFFVKVDFVEFLGKLGFFWKYFGDFGSLKPILITLQWINDNVNKTKVKENKEHALKSVIHSRPAFGRPRPKVMISARAYSLQKIWGTIQPKSMLSRFSSNRGVIAENLGQNPTKKYVV